METKRSGRFEAATAVKQIDTHTYTSVFQDDWTIGSVPHGGYVTSIFQKVTRVHFQTTLLSQNQPDTIALHMEFLRRTSVGPAKFLVKDTKLGRQTSTIHITLSQGDREEAAAYITNCNFETERGLSLDTQYQLSPPVLRADLKSFTTDEDLHWKRQSKMLYEDFRKAVTQVTFFFPRQGQNHKSIVDEWITLRSEEKFTTDSLGFVSDMWPQIVENYGNSDIAQMNKAEDLGPEYDSDSRLPLGRCWYPTLVLNLDIKKALPPEGVSFLFVRSRSKQVRNGRNDIEVIIMDESGSIVALSHHVALIVGAERNLAERRARIPSKI